MLEPLQSEPFLTYALIVLGTVVGGSHGIIYLLSIIGLLLRPFRRRSIAFFYPWVYLTAHNPDNIAETPFRPSRLLLIHTLWLLSSVGLYVGFTLYLLVSVLNELFPELFGLDQSHALNIPAWTGLTVQAVYSGVFVLWSSWMWLRSLRNSIAHYRRMSEVRDDRSLDDPGHYQAPFRKTAGWALATIPIYIGLVALILMMWKPG